MLLRQHLIYQVQGLLSLPPFLPPPFLNLQIIHPEGRGELIMVITAAHGPECWRWTVAERCATGELGAACWDLLSTTTPPRRGGARRWIGSRLRSAITSAWDRAAPGLGMQDFDTHWLPVCHQLQASIALVSLLLAWSPAAGGHCLTSDVALLPCLLALALLLWLTLPCRPGPGTHKGQQSSPFRCGEGSLPVVWDVPCPSTQSSGKALGPHHSSPPMETESLVWLVPFK